MVVSGSSIFSNGMAEPVPQRLIATRSDLDMSAMVLLIDTKDRNEQLISTRVLDLLRQTHENKAIGSNTVHEGTFKQTLRPEESIADCRCHAAVANSGISNLVASYIDLEMDTCR